MKGSEHTKAGRLGLGWGTLCFLDITGKDAWRRNLATKKGNASFQRAGCLLGSKKGKWAEDSLRLLGAVEKSSGFGKVSHSDREIYFP